MVWFGNRGRFVLFCPRDERLLRPVARYADKRGQCAQREEGKKGDQ